MNTSMLHVTTTWNVQHLVSSNTPKIYIPSWLELAYITKFHIDSFKFPLPCCSHPSKPRHSLIFYIVPWGIHLAKDFTSNKRVKSLSITTKSSLWKPIVKNISHSLPYPGHFRPQFVLIDRNFNQPFFFSIHLYNPFIPTSTKPHKMISKLWHIDNLISFS